MRRRLGWKEINWERVYREWYVISEEDRKDISHSLLSLGERGRKEAFKEEPYARRVYVEKMLRFDNEEHLLLWLYTYEPLGEKYPKVTTIARTKLSPDIDLLRIERLPGKEPLIVGYEVKVLGKRRVYNSFYTGLGEVLCYFRYGVDRAWLIIGIPEEAPNEVEDKLEEAWVSLKEYRVIPKYVGLILFRECKSSKCVSTPEGRFHASFYDYAKYMRESLLKGQFTYSKYWIKTFISN